MTYFSFSTVPSDQLLNSKHPDRKLEWKDRTTGKEPSVFLSQPLFLRPGSPKPHTSLDICAQKEKNDSLPSGGGENSPWATGWPTCFCQARPYSKLTVQNKLHLLRKLIFWQEIQTRKGYILTEFRTILPEFKACEPGRLQSIASQSQTRLKWLSTPAHH